MSEPKNPGTVYTFYSYKGGVGRSMALANAGVLLATGGQRVLLVDWDLEAPGLEVYFQGSAKLAGDPAAAAGIVDLLEAHARGETLDWRQGLLRAEFFGHSLDLLSAGRRTEDYRRRVQQLDWDSLYREHQVGNFVNRLRDEWREAYDVILIDSRTGITDIGDLCTVLLPDVLVLLFVTNHQNVQGIRDVMARAVRARSKLPIHRSKLLGVPVPARDERDREYQKSLEWQKIFAQELGDLYREWLPRDVQPAEALNKLFIPYVAAWSFGECIPVLESERERSDPTSLGAAYSRLATLLSHRLDWGAIDAKVTSDELAGARLELSKARDEARAAEERLSEIETARLAQRKRRRWIWILLPALGLAGWLYFGAKKLHEPSEPFLPQSTESVTGEELSRQLSLRLEAQRKRLQLELWKSQLDSSDPGVRVEAIEQIARSSSLSDEDRRLLLFRLEEMLLDDDRLVRLRAAEALVEMPGVQPWLIEKAREVLNKLQPAMPPAAPKMEKLPRVR